MPPRRAPVVPRRGLGEPTDAAPPAAAYRGGIGAPPIGAAPGPPSGGITVIATTRMLALSALLALLVGLVLADSAGAEGRFRPRPLSESARVTERNNCQNGGGTSFQTDYHYTAGFDYPTSATTTCHGGKLDGRTCEVGGSTSAVSCTSRLSPTDDRD